MEHVFEDIEGKAKPIEPQGKALKGKGAKCLLDMGSMPMTVLYIPLESRKCHVRRALALAHRSGVGLTLMTWSARVVRDVDLLPAINQKTKCVVQTTQTTCDENVLSLLEKNATFPPPPRAGRAVPPPRVFPRPTVRRSGYAQHVPRLVSRMGKASRSCRYA